MICISSIRYCWLEPSLYTPRTRIWSRTVTGVDRLAVGEHGEHRLEDLAVLLYIEVVRLHLVNDLGDAPRVDQHGAEDRLLGACRVRRLPAEKFVHVRSLWILFLFRHEHVYRAAYLAAQLGLHLVAAELLDGLGLHDAVLLDLDAVLLAQGVGYLLAGDGAEERPPWPARA